MEKLSRVKKYEELRKSIETDNHVDVKEDAVLHPDETLKQFDTSVVKKVEIKEDDYQPEREKVVEETPVNETVDHNEFTNEYLDDFIKEVRQYNIRKGTRESENTQVDILNQLNAINRAKRTQYVESIQDETPEEEPVRPLLNKENIALEVQNLLREEDDVVAKEEIEPIQIEEPVADMTIQMEAIQAPVMDEWKEEPVASEEIEEESVHKKRGLFKKKEKAIEEQEEEEKVEPTLHKKILEETQQLRVQMDEYEDELTDLSDGVEKTNKLLNFVLCFLILVLLVIIGFIAYSLLKAGGKI
ncbi:hypothetical protein [[Eubacterium] hominis]|uniref:hypothetical protein n=1 Tax=[Eubacterium] hominis TaxID=2764325 RepID=UPI003A4DBBF1